MTTSSPSDSTLLQLLHHPSQHPFILSITHKIHPLRTKPQAVAPSVDDATGRHTLRMFRYTHEFDHGSLEVRQMDTDDLDSTVQLLAESFAESMSKPARYVALLAFLVRQYVMERRLLIPHATMLIGYYRPKDGRDKQLACIAEISFDALGANASPPTPPPPKDCPYICNMTVKKSLRRNGIGRQLLKACEELISQMKTPKKVYLHCRISDTGPFNMYTKAGYKVVKSDCVFVWLSLQRRKHLMVKDLDALDDDRFNTSKPKCPLASNVMYRV